jgi:uncharacterized protein (TIGR03492 family)
VRRVLFVSNGHGESTIAERIAREAPAIAPTTVALYHLALVGEPRDGILATVGPRRTLPSGGLVAMGNVRAFARDLRGGFAKLFASQLAFLRSEGPRYDCVVAVGDVYGLALARFARRPTVFVGTAKSVFVAPYGPLERRFLGKTARIFVRDRATAEHLQARGIAAEAPGNTIVELSDGAPSPPAEMASEDFIGVLPGSRESAYLDAVRLCGVIRALGERLATTRAVLSIAPWLEAERFAAALARDGWIVEPVAGSGQIAFRGRAGGATLLGWRGALGTLIAASRMVLGQAGTANEQAAAAGLPVVALDADRPPAKRTAGDEWYRMRQARLLGDALALIPPSPGLAADAIAGILADAARLERMRAAGRERMGPRGGSRAIAEAIVAIAFEAETRA